MKWEVKRAEKSELSNLSVFFKHQFQGPLRYGRADMFAWKTFENMVQEGFINLIKDGDIIASTTSITPKRLILNNREINAAEIGDTYTAAEYQRKGMFSTLINTSREQAQEAGFQFVYGTPNNQSLPGYLKNADFVALENLDVRSLSFSFSARSKFRRVLGWSLNEIFDAIYRIYARTYFTIKKPSAIDSDQYSLDQVETLPTDWEAFWTQAAKKYSFIIDRSAKSLDWRYIKNPEKYSFLTARHQGELIGYCVYRNTRTDEGQDIVIADFLFLDGHELALNLCLNKICEQAFLTSVRSLSVWCELTSPYYSIFRNLGLKETGKIPVIYYGKDLAEEINKTKKAHFTIGDSDNV